MTMDPIKCAAHHFGPWMIEANYFRSAVEAVRTGVMKAKGDTVDVTDLEEGKYLTTSEGVAVIPIDGPMMKPSSKYGGTSTVLTRNAIRRAVADPDVTAIVLHIDSPGGTVAGTESLAQDVAAADEKKPVYAHIEDMGASAAYYVASQARRITAAKSSLVGSLGTRLVLVDSSKAAEMSGLKVHDISTGEFKGAGLQGTEITDRQLAYFQSIVDEGSRHFKQAVREGRGMAAEQVDAVFDGRLHDADKAKQLGLIDEVASFDAVIGAITKEIGDMKITADQFSAHAAENPNAAEVKAIFDKGYTQAKADLAEKPATPEQLAEAFPEDPAFCMKQLTGKATMSQANAAAVANYRERAKAADTKAQEAEKKATASAGRQDPIPPDNGGQTGAGAAAVSEARRAELLRMTPTGAAILDDEAKRRK